MIEACVEESIAGYGNTVLYSSARNEYMITRIKKLMYRTVWALTKQLERGRFLPSEYELNFGNGKIDRIDICEMDEKVYVKVMDYKTGSKAFDITAMYHGVQLQLPVYLGAALKYEERKHPEKEVIPAGIFYYQVQDPLVEREEDLLKTLRPDGLVNADGEVVELLDEMLDGDSEVIPVKRNQDKSLSKYSKVLSKEDFSILIEYADYIAERIEKEIFTGDVQMAPYMLGKRTGCDYCKYRGICGFDAFVDGCEYRRLPNYDKTEALSRMRKEV